MDAGARFPARRMICLPHELVALAAEFPLFLALLSQADPPREVDHPVMPADWRGLPALTALLCHLLEDAIIRNLYRLFQRANARHLHLRPSGVAPDTLLAGLAALRDRQQFATPKARDEATWLVRRTLDLLEAAALWTLREERPSLAQLVTEVDRQRWAVRLGVDSLPCDQLAERYAEWELEPKKLLEEACWAGLGTVRQDERGQLTVDFAHQRIGDVLAARALTALVQTTKVESLGLAGARLPDVLALLAGLPDSNGRPRLLEAVQLALAASPGDPAHRALIVAQLLAQWSNQALMQVKTAAGVQVRKQVAALGRALAAEVPSLAALLLWRAGCASELEELLPHLHQHRTPLLGLPSTLTAAIIRKGMRQQGWVAYWAAEQVPHASTEHLAALTKQALAHPDVNVRRLMVEQTAQLPEGKRAAVVRRAMENPDTWVRRGAVRQVERLPENVRAAVVRRGLMHADAAVRRAAVERGMYLSEAERPAAVRRALVDADAGVRREAFGQASHLPEAEQLAAMRRALGDEAALLRHTAVQGVWRLPAREREVALCQALDDPNAWVRRAAIEKVGSISARGWVAAVRRALEDTDFAVRNAAAAIRSFGAEDATVREEAVRRIEYLPEGERAGAVRRALEDANVWVRRAAVEVVGYLPATEGQAALRRMLEDEDAWAREAAIYQMGYFPTAEWTAVLCRGLDDPDVQVRMTAVSHVCYLPEGDRAPVLGRALEDAQSAVRKQVVQRIQDLPDGERTAVLRRALMDADADVCSAAVGHVELLPQENQDEALRRPLEDEPVVRSAALVQVVDGVQLSDEEHSALIWHALSRPSTRDELITSLGQSPQDVSRLIWAMLTSRPRQDTDHDALHARRLILRLLRHRVVRFAEQVEAIVAKESSNNKPVD